MTIYPRHGLLAVMGFASTSGVIGQQYLGCFADSETGRDLPFLRAANVASVEMCAATCGCEFKVTKIFRSGSFDCFTCINSVHGTSKRP